MIEPMRAVARRLLGRPRIVYHARGRSTAVALTFDDGPSPWTPQIAEAIEAHDCLGTFFLCGPAVEERPEAVAALVRAGHELGNHLWTHADPERQSHAALRAEIDRTAAAIKAATGIHPTLVRPPYCGAPRRVARAAGHSRAALIVQRSVDPADWKAASPDEIVERVLSVVEPGDIVCLHDGITSANLGTETREATVAAVVRLVPALLDRGLRPVTVSRLLA